MSDQPHTISRREFAALSLAVGATAAAGISGAAATGVMDADVQVHTPSGVCDAALIHPQGNGRWPAAILFVDAFGLRPTMRDMAKRLAADGYTVLVPNPEWFGKRDIAPLSEVALVLAGDELSSPEHALLFCRQAFADDPESSIASTCPSG